MPNSRIMLNIFNPSDLFKPAAEIKIQDDNINKINKFKIYHKYVGDYHIGIYFENSSPYGDIIDNCGTLKLSFANDDEVFFSRNFSSWRDRFGGPGGGKAGVLLGAYTVPEHIGRGENLNAEIIFEIEETCLKKYGPLTFYIRRGSDF